MRFRTLHKLRKLFTVLVAAMAVVFLVVTGFVLHTLHQSHARYYANAEETSKNLAITLENFLRGHFYEVDLAMRRAALEFRILHQQKRFDDAGFSAFLRSLKERIPHARSVRGSDRDGLVIYGENIDPDKLQDLNIREFFQRAKTERELVFGVPVKSRITGEMVLPLMYALTLPDGSFGGTAYVNMTTDTITEVLKSLNVGRHGVITLVDSQRRLLHRYPEAPGLEIGSQVALSEPTAAMLSGPHRRATYTTTSVRDGLQRVVSVERIGKYPVFVLVGLSSDDFLAPWRDEVRNSLLFLAVLLAMAGALLLGARYALRQQYRTVEKLMEAKDQALEAGRAKSNFVANMSHEIRTPMNAVLGMLQLLQQTPMDTRQRDYAAKAESAARALLSLLNDILDFSKVEEGKLTLDAQPFSMDRLLRDLSVILSACVGSKDVEVLFEIDPALPDWLLGDALRLRQILLNLTGNAVKFTEHGEVVLSVQRTGDSAGGTGPRVAFAIRDTGIGITDEQRTHIFDGFSQGEASTARRFGGTGLGLAISQRLARLMGSTLQVASTPGRGSIFSFELDLPEAQQPAAACEAVQLKDLSCLVVDDNPSARQVLAGMAASFGWRVDTADNGIDALSLVMRRSAGRPYDVLLVDWRMPLLDGWETSARIRELMPEAETPVIIMVTAHDREQLAHKQAHNAEVLDGVLIKPVTASMLFDAVAEARSGQGPAALLQPPQPQQLLEGLRILLVEDNPTNQQVASELLSHEGALVEVAPCGTDAIAAVRRDGPAPDVILMDIQMPDMDGYAATRAILHLLQGAAPPIIAMTANAMQSDREQALAAGMVDHVGKPFDLPQLIAVILAHVGGRRAQGPQHNVVAAASCAAPVPDHALPEQAAAPEAAAVSLDTPGALKRMGGLVQVYQIALRNFSAETAQLAGELEAALASQDPAAAKPALHVLKGLAGTIGAERLSELSAQAEMALRQRAGVPACQAAIRAVLAAIPPVVEQVEQHLALA